MSRNQEGRVPLRGVRDHRESRAARMMASWEEAMAKNRAARELVSNKRQLLLTIRLSMVVVDRSAMDECTAKKSMARH